MDWSFFFLQKRADKLYFTKMSNLWKEHARGKYYEDKSLLMMRTEQNRERQMPGMILRGWSFGMQNRKLEK